MLARRWRTCQVVNRLGAEQQDEQPRSAPSDHASSQRAGHDASSDRTGRSDPIGHDRVGSRHRPVAAVRRAESGTRPPGRAFDPPRRDACPSSKRPDSRACAVGLDLHADSVWVGAARQPRPWMRRPGRAARTVAPGAGAAPAATVRRGSKAGSSRRRAPAAPAGAPRTPGTQNARGSASRISYRRSGSRHLGQTGPGRAASARSAGSGRNDNDPSHGGQPQARVAAGDGRPVAILVAERVEPGRSPARAVLVEGPLQPVETSSRGPRGTGGRCSRARRRSCARRSAGAQWRLRRVGDSVGEPAIRPGRFGAPDERGHLLGAGRRSRARRRRFDAGVGGEQIGDEARGRREARCAVPAESVPAARRRQRPRCAAAPAATYARRAPLPVSPGGATRLRPNATTPSGRSAIAEPIDEQSGRRHAPRTTSPASRRSAVAASRPRPARSAERERRRRSGTSRASGSASCSAAAGPRRAARARRAPSRHRSRRAPTGEARGGLRTPRARAPPGRGTG